jgi:hypothetical protein
VNCDQESWKRRKQNDPDLRGLRPSRRQHLFRQIVEPVLPKTSLALTSGPAKNVLRRRGPRAPRAAQAAPSPRPVRTFQRGHRTRQAAIAPATRSRHTPILPCQTKRQCARANRFDDSKLSALHLSTPPHLGGRSRSVSAGAARRLPAPVEDKRRKSAPERLMAARPCGEFGFRRCREAFGFSRRSERSNSGFGETGFQEEQETAVPADETDLRRPGSSPLADFPPPSRVPRAPSAPSGRSSPRGIAGRA